ncbi:DUF4468 domain-containing protein [Chryseobacterium sp.]|uniref:DUF4468 domain-containing protein n=1 Tax=Chryseobacterium sp. TaxID=1871047 RepID=UPI0025C4A341|nr:DUF4468 domain-containing protein [Chryseobacterium sp.]
MKKTFTVLSILIAVVVYSQDLKYEDVVKVDSTIAKDELYNRARTWTSQVFSSKNNMVTAEDKQLGEISGVGYYDYRVDKKYKGSSCVEGSLSFKFSIFVKDGRYKYVFHSFDHKGSRGNICNRIDYGRLTLTEEAPEKGRGIAYNYGWEDVKYKTRLKVEALVSELKEAMNKKYEGSNDW